MLKINLLPPYINQRSKIRTAWTMMAVVLAAELAGLAFYQASLRSAENEKIDTVTTKERQVTAVEQLKQKANAELAKIQPIKEKTDFISQLRDYNLVRPDLYEHVASYIYQEIWISGMQAEQNVLTMPARGKSISSVGRFLLFMQNNPDFTQVRISSVPGWPPGTAGVEAGPVGYGGGGQPGGPAGYGGTGGPPGGAPPGYGGTGGPPGGGPPGGAPPGYGGTGGPPGGAPPGYGGTGGGGTGGPEGAPPIFGGGAAPGGEPGLMNVPTPGAEGATAGGAPIPYPTELSRPKLLPNYFDFTVTGVLAKPIVRPTYLGAGAEGETAGVGGPPGYGGTGGPPGYGGTGGPPGSAGPPGAGSAGPYSSGGPPGGPTGSGG